MNDAMKSGMMGVAGLVLVAGQAVGQCGPQKFQHFGPATGDRFGAAVAAAGNVMVVGCPSDDNAGATNGGSRHIFERINGSWYWMASTHDAGQDRAFGRAVATDGAVIATGRGGGTMNGAFPMGGGSITHKSGGSWVSPAMPAVGLVAGDEFGFSVAVGAGRIAFGAPRRDFNAGDDMGAVYVYRIDGQGQVQLVTTVIRPANSTQAGEHFGYSVAIAPAGGPNAGMLVVGSPDRDSVNAASTGGIYVFNMTGQGYSLQNLPTQWDEAFQFNGLAVATNGEVIASGAPSFGNARGRVFLYEKTPNGNWEPVGFIAGPDGDGGNFGQTISMNGEWMIIGAPGLDKAYIYRRNQGSWALHRVVWGTALGGTSTWGSAVATDGTDFFAGDVNDDAGDVSVAGTVTRLGLGVMRGGDEPAGAELIGVPATIEGCLVHATPLANGLPGMCGWSQFSPDVYFKFTARGNGRVIADTLGSGFDTVLSAHSPMPTWQDANLVQCNDDFGGQLTSRVAFNVERGETYWLRVAGFSGAVGAFDLNVRWSCVADFNEDGFVDFFDYDDFVTCFDGGSCVGGRNADVNFDGFTDFFDFDDYVAAFETGC